MGSSGTVAGRNVPICGGLSVRLTTIAPVRRSSARRRATASTGRRRCIRRQPDAYSLIGNATGFVIAMIGSLVMGSLRESRKLLTDRSR